MIKFRHKKHMQEDKDNSKIIVYYNISDIFLGTALLILVVFFIHDYLSHALGPYYNKETPNLYTNQAYPNQPKINLPTQNPKY